MCPHTQESSSSMGTVTESGIEIGFPYRVGGCLTLEDLLSSTCTGQKVHISGLQYIWKYE